MTVVIADGVWERMSALAATENDIEQELQGTRTAFATRRGLALAKAKKRYTEDDEDEDLDDEEDFEDFEEFEEDDEDFDDDFEDDEDFDDDDFDDDFDDDDFEDDDL